MASRRVKVPPCVVGFNVAPIAVVGSMEACKGHVRSSGRRAAIAAMCEVSAACECQMEMSWNESSGALAFESNLINMHSLTTGRCVRGLPRSDLQVLARNAPELWSTTEGPWMSLRPARKHHPFWKDIIWYLHPSEKTYTTWPGFVTQGPEFTSTQIPPQPKNKKVIIIISHVE